MRPFVVRFDPRPKSWLPVPVDWPSFDIESPMEIGVAAQTLRFGVHGGRDSDRWCRAVEDHILELPDDHVNQRYLWIGSEVLPPVILGVTQFAPVGTAQDTLALIAGLDGSVEGAVEVADAGTGPGAAMVRSDRRLPGRAKSFRKPALPDRVEVRWAVRFEEGLDVLIELSATPVDLVDRAVADAAELLGTARVVGGAEAARLDKETGEFFLERWEAARIASLANDAR